MRSDRPLLFLITAILCVLFFKFCACNIEETEHAVIFSFGRPLKVILHHKEKASNFDQSVASGLTIITGAGFLFKAPWHSVHRVESRILCTDPPPFRVLMGGEMRDLDYFCLWRITAPQIFLGRISSEANGNLLIEEVVGSKLLTELQSKSFTTESDAIARARAAAQIELHAEGIELVGLHVKEFCAASDSRRQAVARLVQNYQADADAVLHDAQQQAQLVCAEADATAEAVLAAARREAEAIRADADALALQIRSDGFEYTAADRIPPQKLGTKVRGSKADQDFFSFLQSLAALEKIPLDKSQIILKKNLLETVIENLPEPQPLQ